MTSHPISALPRPRFVPASRRPAATTTTNDNDNDGDAPTPLRLPRAHSSLPCSRPRLPPPCPNAPVPENPLWPRQPPAVLALPVNLEPVLPLGRPPNLLPRHWPDHRSHRWPVPVQHRNRARIWPSPLQHHLASHGREHGRGDGRSGQAAVRRPTFA